MRPIELKKLFTYGFIGLAGLEWGLSFLAAAFFVVHFLIRNYALGMGLNFSGLSSVVALLFFVPAVMTLLSVWLPLQLRREDKNNAALVVALVTALLWLPFGLPLLMHIPAGTSADNPPF